MKGPYRHYKPIDLTGKRSIVVAAQCVAAGQATEGQQQQFMRFLIEDLGMQNYMSFSPESERETCFGEGRRFVANQLVKMIKLNVSAYFKEEE